MSSAIKKPTTDNNRLNSTNEIALKDKYMTKSCLASLKATTIVRMQQFYDESWMPDKTIQSQNINIPLKDSKLIKGSRGFDTINCNYDSEYIPQPIKANIDCLKGKVKSKQKATYHCVVW